MSFFRSIHIRDELGYMIPFRSMSQVFLNSPSFSIYSDILFQLSLNPDDNLIPIKNAVWIYGATNIVNQYNGTTGVIIDETNTVLDTPSIYAEATGGDNDYYQYLDCTLNYWRYPGMGHDFYLPDGFTFDFWSRVPGVNNEANVQTVFYLSSIDGSEYIYLARIGSGFRVYYTDINDSVSYLSNAYFEDSSFAHWAFTVDESGTLKFYKNGSLQQTSSTAAKFTKIGRIKLGAIQGENSTSMNIALARASRKVLWSENFTVPTAGDYDYPVYLKFN